MALIKKKNTNQLNWIKKQTLNQRRPIYVVWLCKNAQSTLTGEAIRMGFIDDSKEITEQLQKRLQSTR